MNHKSEILVVKVVSSGLFHPSEVANITKTHHPGGLDVWH